MSIVDELGASLRRSYDAAPKSRKAASIHLFGITNAKALAGVSKIAVAERAGLPSSYGTELSKGVNLAEYVSVTNPLV